MGLTMLRQHAIALGERFPELSEAQRSALVTCFMSNGLRRSEGAWRGEGDNRISGMVVADLSRDGWLAVNKVRGLAQLTELRLQQVEALLVGSG